jgi:hypothetical protein
VKSREVAVHEQAKEIKKLRYKLSELEKMIFELLLNGVYAFCVCL